jgi:hypothetical protein
MDRNTNLGVDDYLTVETVASALGRDQETIRQQLRQGKKNGTLHPITDPTDKRRTLVPVSDLKTLALRPKNGYTRKVATIELPDGTTRQVMTMVKKEG